MGSAETARPMSDANLDHRFGLLPPEHAATLSGLDFLNGFKDGLYPAPPFSEISGVWPLSIVAGYVVFEGMPSARFCNPLGIVHGGWIALLLDTVMGCAVHSALPAGKGFATIDMTTNFVRPVSERTGMLRAEGRLLHLGKRIGSAEGKLFDGRDRLVAFGSETCAISELAVS
jgi:uncharacterized protein (TIGR00369 family)